MGQVSLSFPDSTYTSSNKPSADTLKSDLSTIEAAINANDTAAVKTTTSDVSSTSWVLDEDAMGSDSAVKLPTQQSVKAYVDAVEDAILAALYPVGSIFISGSATMPSKIDALGTWARIEGKMIVGASDSDGDFDNGDTGGAKEVTLTAAQSGLPQHNHGVTDPGHFHGLQLKGDGDNGSGSYTCESNDSSNSSTYNTGSKTTGITIDNVAAAAASEAHSVMNPYKAKYMWERTA